MLDRMPERLSEYMPERMSDIMSEYIYIHSRWSVRNYVGRIS
jgi:hypothetical protein